MKPEIKEIMKLAKLSPSQKGLAEDYYTNLSMSFKNAGEGLSRVKQIMARYKLGFKPAYDAALDPKQLRILKTMSESK